MKLLFTIFMTVLIVSSYAQDSLNYYYQAGLKSMQSGDLKAYEESFQSANRLRPYHPTIVYHLANSNALLGNDLAAFEASKVMLLMNGDINFLDDSAFLNFNKSKHYNMLKKLEIEINKPVMNSREFKKINLKSLHPEAIEMFDKKIYLGGVHDRKIVLFKENQEVDTLINFTDNEDMYAIMGLAYDRNSNLLWACTAAIPEMKAYEETLKGRSSIVAINTKGKIVLSEVIEGGHLFGDLIVGKNGTVYISDGLKNSIYTISVDKPLEEAFKIADQSYNLQGLALNEDETELFVADYIKGLFKLNLNTGSVEFLKLEGDIVGKGFDGLYFYENSLIGIQNGTTPDRVWRFYLDDEDSIESKEIIDQALKVFDEPTQGLIQNDQFIYVANSPWRYYKDGEFLVDEAPETILLQTKLK